MTDDRGDLEDGTRMHGLEICLSFFFLRFRVGNYFGPSGNQRVVSTGFGFGF